ncbi:hypothetical protein LTR99_010452 [Exophiala xenobiotica]|uniref:SAC domain-containing protein n=1 Tax=Vermiconidia calcicola TaxID=1690605 RepID=A0AAV9PSB6_9PEZI|nr:hypothetical protein LTR92_007595 [Exophiala xenobiotica]KAK5528609.1 hypothetical protein LTR25_010222 [Vermiconidia calcicola]KAK5546033.1 hypothetical protein LTR23_003840 [Chaetothyriales sp. CCFEE 6169]KAK5220593.1 hypothetical protein LTR72_007215 [Exophiala xenobiotica]KAK5267716.1 hypothetical protein LTR96_007044 [Exophiala xenobiotica]
MPALVRRLLIWATVDGLVLQAHGSAENHKAIQIDYTRNQIKELQVNDAASKKVTSLEAHGVIGLLSIASSTFLIAITQREQVAQIFGKPVYVIQDVALLPLSSQKEAERAITSALTSRESSTTGNDSDSDFSEPGEEDETSPKDVEPDTPVEHPLTQQKNSSSTSIVRDVIANRGQYASFASQWFSKQGWRGAKTGTANSTAPPQQTQSSPTASSTAEGDAAAAANLSKPQGEGGEEKQTDEAADIMSSNSIRDALPRIVKTTRMILTSGSYFFSYDFDLTRRLVLLGGNAKGPARETLDPLYFWNRRLATPFLDSNQDAFLMPILQGFVGQRAFTVKKAESKDPNSACIVSAEHDKESAGLEHAISHAKEGLASISGDTQDYLLTLISRRSVKRSGLRYLRRGIDDEGNCANAVETEQILSSPDWASSRRIRSFVQIRCSIPLYFSQSPYSFKPAPIIHQSAAKNDNAMKKHFHDLKGRYGGVQIAALVDKHGTETNIGQAYEEAVRNLKESNLLDGVQFEWFDFHAECRGMKFENVSRLVDKLEPTLEGYGQTTVSSTGIETSQSGVIRTNCMDCLDRTNVAQSAFGQYMLQKDLAKEGFAIDLLHDETTTWFNTLWADNGDAISRQYASTAALKGDFTRTRRRNYRGALNDFSLTLTRYYNNMVNDYFSQAVIDVLLGNVSWKVFEDFENNMMSADPGINIEQIREAAIENCRKQVIQDADEDLIHGWTMLTPAHENTLRTIPFEEAVVLLTDAALYCCKFDWTTEKLRSFEKINLRSISKIRYGTYITSTFGERQMKEEYNAGLVVVYQPSKDSIIRTNTRSLQNYVEPASDDSQARIDGGTGILSWLSPSSPPSSRTVAMKVIDATETRTEPPLAMAGRIAEEIRRAITGPQEISEQPGGNELVEQEDIISLADAKKRTGYLEQLGYSIKKLVWS